MMVSLGEENMFTHGSSKSEFVIRRRDLLSLLLAAGPVALPALGGQPVIGTPNSAGSYWEARGRVDASRGIFWPPRDHIAWPHAGDRQEADAEYGHGYWGELARLRFENGEYDLL
jgi:hypothetical protein